MNKCKLFEMYDCKLLCMQKTIRYALKVRPNVSFGIEISTNSDLIFREARYLIFTKLLLAISERKKRERKGKGVLHIDYFSMF